MSCDDRRTAAFVRGELSGAEEEAFDGHLLACEACWRAVQEDRRGRLALEQLRVPAPLGLADRVVASVGLVRGGCTGSVPPAPAGARRAPTRRLVVALVAAVAVVGGALAAVLVPGRAADPPQIARVLAMTSAGVAGSPALRRGEHLEVGGQPLEVRSYRVDGVVALVATSTHPFPMPARSHLLSGSSPAAWMATSGRLALYGVNRRPGQHRQSVFLVADMPVERLPDVAARLHLL